MLKRLLLVPTIGLLASSAAFAHVQLGTYAGASRDGAACTMEVLEVFYQGGVPNPLNERVRVTIAGTEYIVGHPPVIDTTTGVALFDHEKFQGIFPTEMGAQALVIGMSHSGGHDGPTSFNLVDHNWDNEFGTVQTCLALHHQDNR